MQQKPCDWICTGCKNLNYSFRKFCNRCPSGIRDSIGTRFIPNTISPKQCLWDSIKLEENNLGGSGHSEASSLDDCERENVVFSQALFLQDLSKTTQQLNQGFTFQKTCKICNTKNYFYQARCCQCGFASFT